jgi:hypothetical protein
MSYDGRMRGAGAWASVGAFALACVAACSATDPAPAVVAGVSTVDAGPDVAPRPRRDASADDDAGSTCAPQNIDPSSLAWKPPNAVRPGACAQAQIGGWYDACWGDSWSKSVCDAFEKDAANRGCLDCLFYAPNASTRGAAEVGAYLRLNVAGCIAIVSGDATATGCGAKLQAETDCPRRACEPVCPLETARDYDRYEACENAAYDGLCAAYVDAEGGCADLPAYRVCRGGSYLDFRSAFIGISSVFCGGSAVDAGPEPGDAGGD